jgi:hypothetical protein
VRIIWKSGSSIASGMTILDARDGSHANALLVDIYATQQFHITLHGGGVANGLIALANTTYVLYAVFNGQAFDLYVNGSALGAVNASALTAMGDYLYLGTNYSATGQANGTIKGVALFDVALSTAEMTADAANIAEVLTDGRQVEPVLWVWTKDGDDQCDNYYDATHNMHAVIGGVPGTADALTHINLSTNENTLGFNVYLALYKVDAPIDVSDFFSDDGGTVDAAALGGLTAVVNVSTGSLYIMGTTLSWRNFKGGSLTLLIRAKDAGTNLTLTYNNKTVPSVVGTDYGLQLLPEQYIDFTPETAGIGFLTISARRSTGSGNYAIDYDLVLPGDVCVLRSESNGYNLLDYLSSRGNVHLYNIGYVSEISRVGGKIIELRPNVLNYLFSHVGDANTSILTRTVTYNFIKVTPRYEII